MNDNVYFRPSLEQVAVWIGNYGDGNPDERKILVTPEIAQELLRHNTANRSLSTGRIRDYAKQMTNGQWKYNGETISVSTEGILLNGQHRLHAIIVSGIAQQILVVRGLSSEVFDTLDQNKPRSAGDVLSCLGYAQANGVAALARILIGARKNGTLDFVAYNDGGTNRNLITQHNIKVFVGNNYHLMEKSIPYGKSIRSLTPKIGAAIHMIVTHIDPEKGSEFMRQVWPGENLVLGMPAMAFSQKVASRRSLSKARTRDTEYFQWAACAWNAVWAGKKLRNVKDGYDINFIGIEKLVRKISFEGIM